MQIANAIAFIFAFLFFHFFVSPPKFFLGIYKAPLTSALSSEIDECDTQTKIKNKRKSRVLSR